MTYIKARDTALNAARSAELARRNSPTAEERHMAEALGLLAEAVAELASSLHRASD